MLPSHLKLYCREDANWLDLVQLSLVFSFLMKILQRLSIHWWVNCYSTSNFNRYLFQVNLALSVDLYIRERDWFCKTHNWLPNPSSFYLFLLHFLQVVVLLCVRVLKSPCIILSTSFVLIFVSTNFMSIIYFFYPLFFPVIFFYPLLENVLDNFLKFI